MLDSAGSTLVEWGRQQQQQQHTNMKNYYTMCIYICGDEREKLFVSFVDVQKAFDRVSHDVATLCMNTVLKNMIGAVMSLCKS